jgi:hypothetical protein
MRELELAAGVPASLVPGAVASDCTADVRIKAYSPGVVSGNGIAADTFAVFVGRKSCTKSRLY